MAGLGQVRADGEVARHLPVVGGVAPEGPGHELPGREHGAVDVDRGELPREVERNDPRHEERVEASEGPDRSPSEPLQPPAERTVGRKISEATEPLEEGISPEEVDVAQTASSDQKEPNQDAADRDRAEVSAWDRGFEMRPKQVVEPDESEVAADQFESRVGGEPVSVNSTRRSRLTRQWRWAFLRLTESGLSLGCLEVLINSQKPQREAFLQLRRSISPLQE